MTRRSLVAAISIVVHAIVVLTLMTADLWNPISEWPSPRSAMAFVDEAPRPVRLEDVPLPAPSRSPAPGHAATPTTSQHLELAPVISPTGRSRDTDREGSLSFAPSGPLVHESNGSDLGGLGAPSDPSPPPPPTPIRLHSSIRAPQRIVNVAPVYPAIAKSAHVEGVVIIEATIDEHGNVVRTEVLRSIPLLDAAALDAVRQWKFSPTLLNGIAVPIVMTVTVNFTLQ